MSRGQTDMTDIQIEHYIETAHMAERYGLLKCSSGNMSMRLSDEHAAVSGSGAWLGCLEAGQIAVCSIETGESINGVRPSIEKGFHLGILRERSDVNTVLHFQSPYATVAACSDLDEILQRVHNTIEMPAYIGRPAVVEYAMPGSDALAASIVDCYRDPAIQVVVLRNHGQVAVGMDGRDALQKAVFFEMNCMIALTSPGVRPLNAEQCREISQLGKA